MATINWNNFIDPQYWLDGFTGGANNVITTPPIDRQEQAFLFNTILYGFTFFIVAGILLRILQLVLHYKHPLQEKLPFWGNTSIWMGILGTLWLLSRQIQIAFLGARLWLLFGLIWLLVMIFLAGRYFFKFFPLEMRYFTTKVLTNQEK
jgi:hypothetical protein